MRIDWNIAKRLPWEKTDKEIAEQFGVCSRTIWLWRKRMKAPPNPVKTASRNLERLDLDWGGKSLAELAKENGVSRQRMSQIRKRLFGKALGGGGMKRIHDGLRPTFAGGKTPVRGGW